MHNRFENCTAYNNPSPEPFALTPLLTIKGDVSYRTIDVKIDHSKHSVAIYVPSGDVSLVLGCHLSVFAVAPGESESVVIS